MTQTSLKEKYSFFLDSPIKRLTFEEYLEYEDNTDTKYELYRGKLIPMATPTGLHTKICKYLVYQFQLFFATSEQNLVAVSDVGVRTGIDSSRIPDVIITTTELWEKVCTRKGSGTFDLEETPQLVIEVSSENWREDYILKRAEYALIEIPEYWIVDPDKQRVRILNHPEGEDGYEHHDFVAGEKIKSLVFPQLNLSVEEMLSPPIVEDLIKAEQRQRQQLELELEQERQRAEQERERAEQERQRAEQERQRAEKLERILRERGISIDE